MRLRKDDRSSNIGPVSQAGLAVSDAQGMDRTVDMEMITGIHLLVEGGDAIRGTHY